MIRVILLLISVLFVTSCTTTWGNDVAPKRWSVEQQEIISLLENGPMGIETNFEAWEREYHGDWTVWFPGQDTARAKEPHMASVREYIESGAKVVSYEADFADITIIGKTAIARFNAVETIMEPNGEPRVIHYGSTDFLIRVGDEWKIRTTTVAIQPAPENL